AGSHEAAPDPDRKKRRLCRLADRAEEGGLTPDRGSTAERGARKRGRAPWPMQRRRKTMAVRDLIPWSRNQELAPARGSHDPFMTLHREMNRLFDDVFRGFGG